MFRFYRVFLSVFSLFFMIQAQAQQFTLDSTVVTARNVVTTLITPWEILWGPDGWIWCTERGGRISRIDPDNGTIDVLADLSDNNGGPVIENGEGGMLGMLLHPDFPDSSYLYVVYQYGSPYKEKLVRLFYDGDTLLNEQVLVDNITGASIHNGSRIILTPDRKILMSTGDAANTGLPQNVSSLSGKTLRINLDGSIPNDNPISNSYVWNWGQRNVQGMVYARNRVYSSMHGWNSDDEINILTAGANYGWPNVEGACNLTAEQTFCADSNVIEPIKAWTPTIAACGLDYYDHPAIPEWRGKLLLATLKEADIRVLELDANGDNIVGESIEFNSQWGRLRDICVSPDGRVFIANNANTAGTSRIVEIKNDSFTTIPIMVDAGSDTLVCQNEQVVLGGTPTATGGNNTLTYTWLPTTGLSCTTCANPLATIANSTQYVVSVSDGLQTVSDTINIQTVNAPAVIADFTYTIIDTILPDKVVVEITDNSIGADTIFWNSIDFNGDTIFHIGDSFTDTFNIVGQMIMGEICMVSYNACFADNFCDSISETIDIGTGIGAIESNNIIVYPNPAKEFVNIKSEIEGNYVLTDILGKKIVQGSVMINQALTLSLEGYSPGIYCLIVQAGKKSQYYKLMVE
ncbi:MAG: PQQ-dependent sugar dehydrogenase [Chitinophagales bacterium]|nr:PQQ-dependent sugar dehydrogenase [Chitinophagales bacterium]